VRTRAEPLRDDALAAELAYAIAQALARLAQDEESVVASGEARGGRGLGQGAVAVKAGANDAGPNPSREATITLLL